MIFTLYYLLHRLERWYPHFNSDSGQEDPNLILITFSLK